MTTKTFKITFFEAYDIFSVMTYHNVGDQHQIIERVANNIVTLDLAPFVRCEIDGEDTTGCFNYLLKYAIRRIEPTYAVTYLTKINAL